jgi:hypothetical protein
MSPSSNRNLAFFAVGVVLTALVLLQMVLFHFYSSAPNSLGDVGVLMPQHRCGHASMTLLLPFQGVYKCRNLLESYGAAWLTTKSRFLSISQHPYKAAMRNTSQNWTLANVQWGKPDSMEVGSELVLKGAGGALRTIDALEFAVEHLSGYTKFLRHDQKLNGTDWKTQEMVRILLERIHEMQTSRTTRSEPPPDIRRLADRVLVVVPFHAASGSAIFGGVNTQFRGNTGNSYTQTRNYFFQATLVSLSPLFSKIAVFVENHQDHAYCQSLQARGFPLMEINLLSDIPDNRFLPEATVYELERRMVQSGSTSMYGDCDYVYFSEADQILRLRPHQLHDLLAAVDDTTTNAVITPHRLAPIPHPKDFGEETRREVLDAIGTSTKKFGASKFLAMEQKPVARWCDDMHETLRCCMDPRDDGRNHHQNWVPFSVEDEFLINRAGADYSPHAPITLLNVGPYHVVNGDADLWNFEWRTCRLERNLHCSTA